MDKNINSLFTDKETVAKIKRKLPFLFQLAELDNSRDGKLGMEIGSTRERIVIALLIHKYGTDNVKVDIPITHPETDVIVFDKPLSIKTATGKKLSGIKLIWTVDAQKALQFSNNYSPSCDIILVQINWDDVGHFYLIPQEIQDATLLALGKEKYLKLPKQGTNPRGVEMSSLAIQELINHPETKSIEINWGREDIQHNSYDRWVDYWEEE